MIFEVTIPYRSEESWDTKVHWAVTTETGEHYKGKEASRLAAWKAIRTTIDALISQQIQEEGYQV